MAYTTKAKVDDLFGITIPQAVFNDLVEVVKLFIDRYTGKTFEGASADRYYDSTGGYILNVDSFYGTPTISILNADGTVDRLLTEGQANDFVTVPYNTTEKNQIIFSSSGYGRLPRGSRRVKITASWGYGATVPKDIEYVATQLIGALYNSNEVSGSNIKSESLGDYSVTYGDVEQVAEGLKGIGVFQILDLHRDIDI